MSTVAVAAANVIGHFLCFKEGTPIATEKGAKAIEEIEVGDRVLAYDEATGEQGYKAVVRLFRNTTMAWCNVDIQVNGVTETITSTPGHKYYLPENATNRETEENPEHASYKGLTAKWVSARKLKKGDKVLLSDGRYGIVIKSAVERLSQPETTYNFEVEDFHTYYVGEYGVCVHNAGCETKQYRAMSNEEYGSLTKHGKFSTKNGVMADKWMATTFDDAVTWGNRMIGEGNFRVIEIRVSTSSLSKMYYGGPLLDGIGPAYSAHYKYLNEIMSGFRRLL